MNPAKLKELVISPENVEEKDFPELLALLSKYPYFQAASILAAKAKNSSEFIKSAAVRTANRSVLRQIISGEFDQDISLHNIDELEIHSGINAFEKLAKEEEEPLIEGLDSTFPEDTIPDQTAIESDTIEDSENVVEEDSEVRETIAEDKGLISSEEAEKELIDSDLYNALEGSLESELFEEESPAIGEEITEPPLEEKIESALKEEQDKDNLTDFKEANFDSEEELSSMSFEAPDYQFDLDSASSTTSIDEENLSDEPLIKEEKIENKEDENHFDPEIDLPINEEEISNPSAEINKPDLEETNETTELNQVDSFVIEDIVDEPDIDAEVKDLIQDDSFRNDLMDSLNDLQNTRKALADEEIEDQQQLEEEENEVISKIEESEEKTEEIISKEVEPKIENKDSEINEEVLDSEYKEIFKNSTSETEVESIEEESPKNDALNSGNLTDKDVESEEENDTFADADLFDLNYLLGEEEQPGKEKKKMRIETTERQKEIIDKFIEEVPQISIQGAEERTQSELAKELYNKSVSEDLSIMTERMAILFSQQGKNGKAIEIYEQLILKYPEKKTYFATLIENLRNEQ